MPILFLKNSNNEIKIRKLKEYLSEFDNFNVHNSFFQSYQKNVLRYLILKKASESDLKHGLANLVQKQKLELTNKSFALANNFSDDKNTIFQGILHTSILSNTFWKIFSCDAKYDNVNNQIIDQYEFKKHILGMNLSRLVYLSVCVFSSELINKYIYKEEFSLLGFINFLKENSSYSKFQNQIYDIINLEKEKIKLYDEVEINYSHKLFLRYKKIEEILKVGDNRLFKKEAVLRNEISMVKTNWDWEYLDENLSKESSPSIYLLKPLSKFEIREFRITEIEYLILIKFKEKAVVGDVIKSFQLKDNDQKKNIISIIFGAIYNDIIYVINC